jgi:ribonuclease Z
LHQSAGDEIYTDLMPPFVHPRLINHPFGDPSLFFSFQFEKRALLFDVGDIRALSPKDILKISHVFVSHTHMDHFIGFDWLLRLWLGRGKKVHLYGPAGIIGNVEGKLAGYTWNLASTYSNILVLNVTEVHTDYLLTQKYVCQNRFKPLSQDHRKPFSGILLREPSFTVSATILDHFVPCLGFAFEEVFHVNIKKAALQELNLQVGPWLKQFKEALYAEKAPESVFTVTQPHLSEAIVFTLGDLTQRIAKITPGQKIVYITDAAYHRSNKERIIRLAENADHLFIEAAFLDHDAKLASAKAHLTARQAGLIAAQANVKRLTVFHFSPRYTHQAHLLEEEAQLAFKRFRQGPKASLVS